MTENRIVEYLRRMRALVDEVNDAIAKKDREKALKLIQAQKDLTDDFVAESIEVNV